MTCKTAIGSICNYLEDSLSPRGVTEFLQHLDKCGDCRLVLHAAQRTLEVDFDRLAVLTPTLPSRASAA